MCADIYGGAPHVGRGGWTWYTGAAGWMYRLIVETLLGLHLEVDRLRLAPCVPADWNGFRIHYRYRETVYHVTVHQAPDADPHATVDGSDVPGMLVPLVDDRENHRVEVWVRAVWMAASPDDEATRRTRTSAARSPGPSRHAPSG